ncbi:hypothetical protein [Streptomyces sp. NPDC058086]|uniref:hypothetical protein n=1 Tax=Streptomyces sp. NPDC058086 TaxID=3346334 RepID=UPI0036EDB238
MIWAVPRRRQTVQGLQRTKSLCSARRDPRRCLTAAARAALLVVDAWFDVTTSQPRPELATAVAMAVCAELPLAALCAVLAVCALPSRTRDKAPDTDGSDLQVNAVT